MGSPPDPKRFEIGRNETLSSETTVLDFEYEAARQTTDRATSEMTPLTHLDPTDNEIRPSELATSDGTPRDQKCETGRVNDLGRADRGKD